MSKIIIGIHGLKNKPSKKVLDNWWKQSISDGLEKFHKKKKFRFELVYWANFNHKNPFDEKILDEKDPNYIKCPYISFQKDIENHGFSDLRKKILNKLELGFDKILFQEKGFGGLELIEDFTIRKFFKDLDIYYHKNCIVYPELRALDAFRERLAESLYKHRHKKIMLIGHSMGSIIAYDTLTQYVPNIKIDTFVTIGSPLGIPAIIKKILREQGKEINSTIKPKTPDNIKKAWYNFSDLNDKICVNYNLSDDYQENQIGIKPIDFIVKNNYRYKNETNPHKIYGYLRCPEISEVIFEFLKFKFSFFNKF
ncbi:MAG: hypothetical protein K8S23_04740 [Candidatus Cloacimonetes bacterium]|nr:hypothetical protein [Candidatus Cloacimonadota bacterium]